MSETVTSAPKQGAPAVVRAGALKSSIKVEQLTCTIGAELGNVDLGVASRDPDLVAEIRALLLQHRVLFFRDQDHHARRARRLRAALRRARGSPRRRQRSGEPGARAHLQIARSAQ